MFAVEGETRIGHLHGKHRTCRVRLAIVGADSRYHDQIGFGRGLVVKRHRHLSSHHPARRENGPQRIIGGADDSSVVAALGLGDDDLASDQLHGITLEQAQVHETLVLDSLPAAESQW